MSQPPQGRPPYGPDGRPPSGDQPPGGGWGQQPGQGWGPPAQPGPPVPGGYGPPPGAWPPGGPGYAVEDDCSTGTGYGGWTCSGGEPGGQIACRIADDGHVVGAWTDDQHLTQGVVRAPGTTPHEVSALHDWWTVASEYQG